MREKLIELLCYGTAKTETCDLHEDCRTDIGGCGFCAIMADHLIAHGVTVREKGEVVSEVVISKKENTTGWIPVAERLPEVWRDVIICDVREDYVTKGFLDDDTWYENEYVMYDLKEFTHWMPLPNPPKDGDT